METRDLHFRDLVWWSFCDSEKLLCRVEYLGTDYVAVRVLAATTEQVLACGYGVGERINTKASALSRVAES
jgi:hypothetical protein